MPELPEVETIVRSLQPLLEGAQVRRIELIDPGVITIGTAHLTEKIAEYKISSVWRRAKVMIWEMESGYSLLFHLKMTGQIIYESKLISLQSNKNREAFNHSSFAADLSKRGEKVSRFAGGHPTKSMLEGARLPDKSTRAIFYFGNGSRVYFNDQRKFGWIKLVPTIEVKNDSFLRAVGPEYDATDFSPKYLWSKTRNRITPIKAILLDQTVVAGIGNIYADESLHMAKIHPSRKASSLSKAEVLALFNAVTHVLKDGIERGGTSLNTYVHVDGKRGDYLRHARVFRKEGTPCPGCGANIIKIRVAGRGTHVCPYCQKLGSSKS